MSAPVSNFDPPPPYPGLDTKSDEKPTAPPIQQEGYQQAPYPPVGYPPQPYQQQTYAFSPTGQPQPVVVGQPVVMVGTVSGNCPRCRQGSVYVNYLTCCGIFWSIVLFPIGLLCLLCCAEKACSNCGSLS